MMLHTQRFHFVHCKNTLAIVCWRYIRSIIMSFTTETGFLGPKGAQLYYEVAGTGHPLLLIHAGVADSRMWDDQFELFAQHYRVIRYDLRGFGQSEVPAGQFSNSEDIVNLLRFLQVQKASIIGISFGSQIALDFALTYPDMVDGLVLGAPSVGGYPSSEDVQRFNEEEDAAFTRGDLAAATEINLRMWVDGPKRTPEQVNPDVRERVRIMQHHAFTVPYPENAEEVSLTPPAITRLAELHIPTLIIIGDYDIPSKIAVTDYLATTIPGAQKVIIPGVAHMVSMEQPEVFNRAVLAFLVAG
jgi:3-oxoadipate enol-lactonase